MAADESKTTGKPRQEPRYGFGANWSRFASRVDQGRIGSATQELRRLLGDLTGKRSLDIGCCSGLHSLAAVRLGAGSVMGFERDTESVGHQPSPAAAVAPDGRWRVEQEDVLVPLPCRAISLTWSTPGACCTTQKPCDRPWKTRPH